MIEILQNLSFTALGFGLFIGWGTGSNRLSLGLLSGAWVVMAAVALLKDFPGLS